MDVLVEWLDQTRAGDLASLAGVLIALVGFAITIWNVRASKAAALRAEGAANKARGAIRLLDAVTDVSAAIKELEEIRRLHRGGAWPVLPDRYHTLRKSLISIRRLSPGLSNEQRTIIQAALRDLAVMENKVEIYLQRGEPPGEAAWWNEQASRHVMKLHGLLLDLKDQAGAR
jgi:hypothetical protein